MLIVITGDFSVRRGHVGHLFRADTGDPQHSLLGDHVADRPVGSIILLQLGIGRLEPGLEGFRRDERPFALARLEQHIRERRRHTDWNPRVCRHWRQQQLLEQAGSDEIADLSICQMLLREECLIGLVAELAVQSLRRGKPCDLGIDQSLRQGEAIFVGKSHQRALIDEVVDDRVEIAHDGRIAGFRLLLPHLL